MCRRGRRGGSPCCRHTKQVSGRRRCRQCRSGVQELEVEGFLAGFRARQDPREAVARLRGDIAPRCLSSRALCEERRRGVGFAERQSRCFRPIRTLKNWTKLIREPDIKLDEARTYLRRSHYAVDQFHRDDGERIALVDYAGKRSALHACFPARSEYFWRVRQGLS